MTAVRTRIPYLEHCPQCAPAVRCRPQTIRTAGPDAISAQYRCPACLHSWRTSWQREPKENR